MSTCSMDKSCGPGARNSPTAACCLRVQIARFQSTKGITSFILRMDTPGITVRPILQAWGGSRFCEVFFDNVEVPLCDRLGEEGKGWELATVVLAYERGPTELGVVATHQGELRHLAESLEEGDTAS